MGQHEKGGDSSVRSASQVGLSRALFSWWLVSYIVTQLAGLAGAEKRGKEETTKGSSFSSPSDQKGLAG